MPSSNLSQAIKKLDSSAALAAIVALPLPINPAAVNDVDEDGLTSCQRVARAGLHPTLLELIIAGADFNGSSDNNHHENAYFNQQARKPPLQLAIEYGHYYLAQVLLVMGAKTDTTRDHFNGDPTLLAKLDELIEKAKNPRLKTELLFWAINTRSHEDTALDWINRFYPSATTEKQDHAALIRLAIQKKFLVTANQLLACHDGSPAAPSVLSAAYWYVVTNKSCMDTEIPALLSGDVSPEEKTAKLTLRKLNLKEADWILLLKQLEGRDHDNFLKLYMLLETTQPDWIQQSHAVSYETAAGLRGLKRQVYLSIMMGSGSATPYFDPRRKEAIADQFDLMVYAFAQQDLITLSLLFGINQSLLYPLLLSSKHQDLMRFLLLQIPSNDLLKHAECVIEQVQPVFNAAHQVMSKSLAANTAVSDKAVKALRANPESSQLFLNLKRCLKDHVQIDLDECKVTTSAKGIVIHLRDDFSVTQASYIKNLCTPFGVDVSHDLYKIDRFSAQAWDIKRKILSYCGFQDLAPRVRVSHHFMSMIKKLHEEIGADTRLFTIYENNRITAMAAAAKRKALQNEKALIPTQIVLLANFIDLSNRDDLAYENESCYAKTTNAYWNSFAIQAFFLLMMIAGIVGLVFTVPRRNAIIERMEAITFFAKMDTTRFYPQHCYSYSNKDTSGLNFDPSLFCRDSDNPWYDLSVCEDVCRDFLANELPFGFSVAGLILGFYIVLLLSPNLLGDNTYMCGKIFKRMSELSDYSDETQAAFRALKTEFLEIRRRDADSNFKEIMRDDIPSLLAKKQTRLLEIDAIEQAEQKAREDAIKLLNPKPDIIAAKPAIQTIAVSDEKSIVIDIYENDPGKASENVSPLSSPVHLGIFAYSSKDEADQLQQPLLVRSKSGTP